MSLSDFGFIYNLNHSHIFNSQNHNLRNKLANLITTISCNLKHIKPTQQSQEST